MSGVDIIVQYSNAITNPGELYATTMYCYLFFSLHYKYNDE